MLRKTTILVLVAVLLALPACQMNERLAGTVIGAGSGALIGGLATTSVVGVVAGGLAGGVAGYLVGDYLADKKERCQTPCPQPCPPACPPACPPTAGVSYAPTTACVTYQRPPAVAVSAATTRSQGLVEQGRRAKTAPEALYYYDEALRLDPRNAEAWNQIGLARVSAGDLDAGRAAFQRALALDPNHRRARSNLTWSGGR